MQSLQKLRKQKLADKIRYAIIFVIISFFLKGCVNSKERIGDYIQEFGELNYNEYELEKINIDPTYNYPYNVYIKIPFDSARNFKMLSKIKLLKSFNSDSAILKRKLPLDVYDNFFNMLSINGFRNSSVNDRERNISWWPLNFELLPAIVYSIPYSDTKVKRGIVSFDDNFNGRLSLTILNSNIYIIIECWG